MVADVDVLIDRVARPVRAGALPARRFLVQVQVRAVVHQQVGAARCAFRARQVLLGAAQRFLRRAVLLGLGGVVVRKRAVAGRGPENGRGEYVALDDRRDRAQGPPLGPILGLGTHAHWDKQIITFAMCCQVAVRLIEPEGPVNSARARSAISL
ncbi:hypothetical protein Acsp04_01870 [Actinomadura sp. NBRC 104425]|nr:hypothetical protein Acsp04_01870 [Actinomadura sp. NBRC 104425]